MSVKLIPADGWNPWFQNKTFLVKPYNMIILLKGSYNRIHLYKSEDLVLDASISSDKSYRDNGVESMKHNKILWKCSPESIKPPDSHPLTWTVPDEVIYKLFIEDIPVISCSVAITRVGTPFYPESRSNRQYITIRRPPTPEINITCSENCDPSDSFKNTTIQFKCWSHCLDKPPSWTFSPYNETIDRDYSVIIPDGITFLGGAFQPGDQVTFEATLSDASSSLILNYRIPDPKLTLKCLSNCEYEPREETIVQLECSSDCENLKPNWEISRKDLEIKSWLTDGMTMVIKAGVFKDEDDLVITVKSFDSVAKLDIRFAEEVPEIVITCQLFDTTDCKDSLPDPREIVHFTVTCENHCNFLNYSWIVDPTQSGFIVEENLNPPDRNILTINGNTFIDKQDVKISVSSGKALASYDTTYAVKVPELEIECLSNCIKDVGNTLEETKLKPICTANCSYLEYVWSVNTNSPVKVKTWETDKHVLVIPPGTLIDGDNTFTLTSGKGSTTLIKKFEKPVPKLNITCEENCVDSNPGKETTLKVHCLSPPNVCNIDYKWSFTPQAKNFSWAESATFDGRQSILTLKPNSFKDGEVIEFTATDGDKGVAKLKLNFKEPVPKITIVCEKNCDPSHPMYLTELKVICESNCSPEYEWDFSPKPSNPIKAISNAEDSVNIAGEAYSDGQTVTVTAKSGKATATFKITYKLKPPELQVLCKPPCDSPHDPKELLVVNVTCRTYCEKALNYTWVITPIEYDKEKIIFQKNLDSFIILPDTFSDQMNVTITASSEPGNEAIANLTFFEVPPDITINCESNCWEGTPLLDTILSATCNDYCKNVDAFQWILEPGPPDWANISSSPKNTSISIKPETYKDLDIVNVTLIARNANRTKQITFVELPAVLNLQCVVNCNPSNPFEDVILEANCTKYCYKLSYEWKTIEPLPEGWDWEVNARLMKKNTTIKILKEFFHDGDAHRFFVESRKGIAQLDVRFEVPPAELTLTCISNCQPSANPLENVTILAMCLKFCYGDYLWSLSPLPEDFKLPTAEGPNNTLFIPAGIYPDLGSVRVKIITNHSEAFMVSLNLCKNP